MLFFDDSSRFILSISPQPHQRLLDREQRIAKASTIPQIYSPNQILNAGLHTANQDDLIGEEECEDGEKVGIVHEGERSVELRSTLRRIYGIQNDKILYFISPKSPSRRIPIPLDFLIPGSHDSPVEKKNKKPKNCTPYRVLDAPGLRNDFYSNLVSWSVKSNSIAVGLGKYVYIWNKEAGVSLINVEPTNMISSISFSDGDYCLIATTHGKVWLISQLENRVMGCICRDGLSVNCIKWSKDGKSFFLGDSAGVVGCFEIQTPSLTSSSVNLISATASTAPVIPLSAASTPRFKLKSSLIFHKQQICGISLSNDEKEVSVGGNDNYCSVWNISNLDSPQLKFVLPHKAAVKAIAYCPWSKSLLATGGGTKDRKIRFWHTNSGTLLKQFDTKFQITSLIWSFFKKEIIATFGFGDGDDRLLIAGYTFPLMDKIIEVSANSNLRILSATLSPDKESVCVATNDETIRFYKFWNKNGQLLTSSPESHGVGSYGSSIIELYEGIDVRGEIIR